MSEIVLQHPQMKLRQPNASKPDNREKMGVCQIINAMFLFMIMLQIRSACPDWGIGIPHW